MIGGLPESIKEADKIEMGDSDESERLQLALRELMQREGVRRDNLRAALTPDLIKDFRIKRGDSPQRIRDKVTAQLEELARPLSDENKRIARYSYNITGEPKIESIETLGGRQKALQDLGGSAGRTSQDDIKKTILPNFAGQLLARRRKRKLVLIAGGALSAVVLAAAIVLPITLSSEGDSNIDTGGNNGQTQTPGAGNAQTQTPGGSTAQGEPLVFDDLGGGPVDIQVYPGVSESAAHKMHNGTFRDGQTVYALCKTKGRTVSSHPELGELARTSNDWMRIHGSPGVTQYATAVYVENPDALLSKLPDC